MDIDQHFKDTYEGDYNIECIGMLRQWLNERGDDIVTTKELEHWLRPLIQEALAGRELVEEMSDIEGNLRMNYLCSNGLRFRNIFQSYKESIE